ncbi:MAG: lipid IV(A) 3-deoxy-D-manno-octulosonic acid transferase [Pseudomonadota bacterium]
MKLLIFLYSLGFRLTLPFVLARLYWRGRREPLYRRRISERLGLIQIPQEKKTIWLHAVSMGEVKAAIPLVRNLLQQYPQWQMMITTTTATGSQTVQQELGKDVLHYYLPFDYRAAIKRFVEKAKPALVIIMETEIWPNLINYCHKKQIPLLLANARLSAKSAKGYRKIRWLMQKLLNSYHFILAQTQADANRFIQIGAKPDKVKVSGNVKFDITLDNAFMQKTQSLKQEIFHPAKQARKILLLASTHDNEETMLLQALMQHPRLMQDFLIILVPRHPSRFNQVRQWCQTHKLMVMQRSLKQQITPSTQVYLLDSVGELVLFYGMVDIAFVGGSLVPIGGHNVLEAAAWGLPTIVGPYTHNFAKIVKVMSQQKALLQVADVAEFIQHLQNFNQHPQIYAEQGERGKRFLQANRGALAKHLAVIEECLAVTT